MLIFNVKVCSYPFKAEFIKREANDLHSYVLPLETDVTLVRPLTTVYPGVGVETGGGGESLPTVLTPVGSVSSVGAGVASQQ